MTWAEGLALLFQGVVVFVGVLLAEVLARTSARRRDLQAAVGAVHTKAALAIGGLVGPVRQAIDTGPDSTWSVTYNELTVELAKVRAWSRWPLRNHKQIKAEAERLKVWFGHNQDRVVMKGQPLDPQECMGGLTLELMRLAFPNQEPLWKTRPIPGTADDPHRGAPSG